MNKVMLLVFFGVALFIGGIYSPLQVVLDHNGWRILRTYLPGYLSPSPAALIQFVLMGLLVFGIALGSAWLRYQKKLGVLGVLVVAGSLGAFLFAWGEVLIEVYIDNLVWSQEYPLISGIMSIPRDIREAGTEFATAAIITGILAGVAGLLLGKFLFPSTTGVALQERKVRMTSQEVREPRRGNNPSSLTVKLRNLLRLG